MSREEPDRQWFRDWFGEEYLALYPHRDQREARQAVRLFRASAAPSVGLAVLDLACGGGRHLRELEAAGLSAVGLDLSMTLLRRSRALGPTAALVRADMRDLPFEDAAFGGVTSFFTSFGYFEDPSDDRRVLKEMRRVLSADGTFMLDFLNASRVRRDLVDEDVRDIPGARVVQRRTIQGDSVVKNIHIRPSGGGSPSDFVERVRLYERDELEPMLAEAGLVTKHRFGDYDGAPWVPEAPRLILAGRSGAGAGGGRQ